MIKIYCIPHAGGSAYSFNNYQKLNNSIVKFIPMELKGRGKRIKEPFSTSIQAMAYDLFEHIISTQDDSEYMILGHSMGAVIAFELALLIRKNNFRDPKVVLLSGMKPFHYYTPVTISDMSKGDLKEYILSMGATQKELFDNSALSEVFLPIIISDLKNMERYNYMIQEKIVSDIIVLSGQEDYLNNDYLDDWNNYTEKKCKVLQFPGGHFFLYDKNEQIIEQVMRITS